MNWKMIAGLGVAVSSVVSAGQTVSEIPAGTIIAAELTRSADAKKLRVGEEVEARTAADVLARGKVLIPRNTRIIGHVTEVKAHTKESPDSKVGLLFDKIVMKGGTQLAVQTVVQAVGRPLRAASLSGPDPMDVSRGMSMPTIAGGPVGGSQSSQSPSSTRSPDASGAPDATPESTMAPLGPTSQGMVGMKKFSLATADAASVISSRTDNVRLDSGTQLILRKQ